MSDPNQPFQPPPPPATEVEPERKRPANLLWAGIALVVLGILILIGGIAGFIPGGPGTGAAICALGVLFFGLSFTSLPNVPDPPPPMSVFERLAGALLRLYSGLRFSPWRPRRLSSPSVVRWCESFYCCAFFLLLWAGGRLHSSIYYLLG